MYDYINVINEDREENYEEKYDYDGSNNNYKINLDLIYKDFKDSLEDKFYYNHIKTNELKNHRNNNRRKNRKYHFKILITCIIYIIIDIEEEIEEDIIIN